MKQYADKDSASADAKTAANKAKAAQPTEEEVAKRCRDARRATTPISTRSGCTKPGARKVSVATSPTRNWTRRGSSPRRAWTPPAPSSSGDVAQRDSWASAPWAGACRAICTRPGCCMGSGIARARARTNWPPNWRVTAPPPRRARAARCGLVVLCVSADADVLARWSTRSWRGLRAGRRSSSTARRSAPTRRARAARRLALKRGANFVDAPVSGGVEGARDGTLAIMVRSAEAMAFARAPAAEWQWVEPSPTSAPSGAGPGGQGHQPDHVRRRHPGRRRRRWLSQRRRACRSTKLDRHARQGRGLELVLREPRTEHRARRISGRLPRAAAREGPEDLPRDGGASRRRSCRSSRSTLAHYRAVDRAGSRATRTSRRSVPPQGRAAFRRRANASRAMSAYRRRRTPRAATAQVLPAGLLRGARGPRNRADRGAARGRDRARAQSLGGSVCDRSRPHLGRSCCWTGLLCAGVLCQDAIPARPHVAARLRRLARWR